MSTKQGYTRLPRKRKYRLFPYLEDKTTGSLAWAPKKVLLGSDYIFGSAVMVAFPRVLLLCLFYVLWYYMSTTISVPFSIDHFFFSQIIFGVSLFVNDRFNRTESTYFAAWNLYGQILKSIVSSTCMFVGFACAGHDKKDNQRMCVEMMASINLYIKAYMYCIKHIFLHETFRLSNLPLTLEMDSKIRLELAQYARLCKSYSQAGSRTRAEQEHNDDDDDDKNGNEIALDPDYQQEEEQDNEQEHPASLILTLIMCSLCECLTKLQRTGQLGEAGISQFKSRLVEWDSIHVQITNTHDVKYPRQYQEILKIIVYCYVLLIAAGFYTTYGFFLGLTFYVIHSFVFMGVDSLPSIIENPLKESQSTTVFMIHEAARNVDLLFAKYYSCSSLSMDIDGNLVSGD
jgi:predicted membrane chloride channel (bestrophin family)